MKVLYYVPDITQQNGGIRQYACTLLKILAQDNQNEYFVLHNAEDPVILSIINENTNLRLIPSHIGREKRITKAFWYSLKSINKVLIKGNVISSMNVFGHTEQLCNRYGIDVVYCPYQYMPPTSRRTIATLHDVQELHFPEFFSPIERLERAYQHKLIAEESSLIVVSYEHVKQDLIKYFQRTDTNVLVCLLDMKNLWFDKFSLVNMVSLKSYNLPDEFIFYPAVTWPHKNHIGLIKAIANLRDNYNIFINVVFTGYQSSYYEQIQEIVAALNLEQQIHSLGVVTEEVLYTLYHSTQAVVVPTLYEAGSFPLMESILMRIPVVCSNVTSLPDTIGDKKFVFNPSDTDDMANKIKNICMDAAYRIENVSNSDQQAPKLRNTNALTKVVEAITHIERF